MRKGKIVFDDNKKCSRRLPIQVDGRDLLIAAGSLLAIAAVLCVVWWRLI